MTGFVALDGQNYPDLGDFSEPRQKERRKVVSPEEMRRLDTAGVRDAGSGPAGVG